MRLRQASKVRTRAPDNDEPPPDPFVQGKRPETGQFRLQVDRQTKASYETYEAAEQVGLAIKHGHPIVQVAVYDVVGNSRKLIELPKG
jgi:hypothetical protein